MSRYLYLHRYVKHPLHDAGGRFIAAVQEGLAVAAAEQEHGALQVLAPLTDAGVADELLQRTAGASRRANSTPGGSGICG